MPKVSCVVIWKHKAIQFGDFPVEDGRVKINGHWKPQFGIDNFITERKEKRWFEFWKSGKGKDYLLLKEDLDHALKPTSTKFDENWSLKEAKTHVAKEVSKAHEMGKPFSNWQLVIVLIPIAMTLVGVLYIVSRII